MRADKIVVAGLLAAACIISTSDMVMGQSGRTNALHRPSRKAHVTPGDPRLLTPEMLTPEVQPRLFVDSFLVSLFTMDSGVVYDAYLHPDLQAILSREAFHEQVATLEAVVGPLTRATVTYLRQVNKKYDGMDGGWTEHLLTFERDPRVHSRVEFRRVTGGHWKVLSSRIDSAQLDRLQREREAARLAGEAAARESEEGGDGEKPSPDSRP